MAGKITDELLKEIAMRYCSEHIPLSELAKEYGVSKTTLVRYFNRRMSVKLPPDLQTEVDKVKRLNWTEGKSTSGNLGNTKLTDEQIVALANYMVTNDLSLGELVSDNTPVKSRLFELFTEEKLGSELYSKVLLQYEKNNRSTFNEHNEGRRSKK